MTDINISIIIKVAPNFVIIYVIFSYFRIDAIYNVKEGKVLPGASETLPATYLNEFHQLVLVRTSTIHITAN